jgi:hypothetical protein
VKIGSIKDTQNVITNQQRLELFRALFFRIDNFPINHDCRAVCTERRGKGERKEVVRFQKARVKSRRHPVAFAEPAIQHRGRQLDTGTGQHHDDHGSNALMLFL